MESQVNARDSYTENRALGVDRNPRIDGVTPPPLSKTFFMVAWILRLLAICSTLVSAIVMGTNKQTAMVAIQLVPLDPFDTTIIIPGSAKSYYSPAFIFFVVANAIACGYTVLSLIPGGRLAFKSGVYSLKPAFLLAVGDLVMVALVSSGASAAAAIAYVGYKGNSHSLWPQICDNFGRFCHQTAGAIVTSFVGVIIFMILTVMSIYGIYKHSSRAR